MLERGELAEYHLAHLVPAEGWLRQGSPVEIRPAYDLERLLSILDKLKRLSGVKAAEPGHRVE